MRKTVFILFTLILFNSCAIFYSPNLNQLSSQLELGMSKQEAIRIMGNDYFVESSVQTPDGKLEVLHFRSTYYSEYLLFFLEGNLSEFHRYIPNPASSEPVGHRHEQVPFVPTTVNNTQLTPLGGGYAKDNWNVFYNETVIKDASVSSLAYLGNGYAKDNWNVFHRGNIVKDASSSSFKNLGGDYAKDNWNVFYRGNIMKGASASSFEYLENGYAKDNWDTYYRGKKAGN